MSEQIKTPGKPNTAPMIFHTNAPWEMRKALDSGCLCKDCETFHSLRRGLVGACTAIDTISARIELSNIATRRKATDDLVHLKQTKAILSPPSKCDTIVKCLHPCLASGKLEDVKPTCLASNECDECGFGKLWSEDLRATLLSGDDTLIDSAPLAGLEWTQPGINWQYYTSVAKPTVAAHAKRVAC